LCGVRAQWLWVNKYRFLNPKHEIQNSNARNHLVGRSAVRRKCGGIGESLCNSFRILELPSFGFVSDFDIRISDFRKGGDPVVTGDHIGQTIVKRIP
jgi:hypothetical protein